MVEFVEIFLYWRLYRSYNGKKVFYKPAIPFLNRYIDIYADEHNARVLLSIKAGTLPKLLIGFKGSYTSP